MRTTVRLNESLMTEVKRYAAKRQITITAVIEEALRDIMAREKKRQQIPPTKLTTVGGRGLFFFIYLDDTSSLIDAMEGNAVT